MVIRSDLLELALRRREEFEALQDEVERARASFHRAVRHLYVEGAPLREIADALGLSHQRVHQIVGEADPVEAEESSGTGPLSCSFCGRNQKECSKLIAGPAVYICDRCVTTVDRITCGALQDDFAIDDDPSGKCSFCGKKGRRLEWIVSARNAEGPSVCNECMAVVHEILREEGGEPPAPQ